MVDDVLTKRVDDRGKKVKEAPCVTSHQDGSIAYQFCVLSIVCVVYEEMEETGGGREESRLTHVFIEWFRWGIHLAFHPSCDAPSPTGPVQKAYFTDPRDLMLSEAHTHTHTPGQTDTHTFTVVPRPFVSVYVCGRYKL